MLGVSNAYGAQAQIDEGLKELGITKGQVKEFIGKFTLVRMLIEFLSSVSQAAVDGASSDVQAVRDVQSDPRGAEQTTTQPTNSKR